MGRVRVGISGWLYPRWRGTFYPEGLRHADELAYAARAFDTVEINGSFYSLQRPASYVRWRDATPPGFVFAVKGGRFITHMKKLRDVDAATANFFASGVLALGDKLGPVLWQLPPNLGFDEGRLREFLELIPRDTRAAARLARRHDAKLGARAYARVDAERRVRHAIEVRHPSFDDPRFYALLEQHGVGLVVADSAGRFPFLDRVTADFVYVRLHGEAVLYTSGYSREAIVRWARRVRAWAKAGRDVYVYFDNDAKVRAPFDAAALAETLGVIGGRRQGAELARDVLDPPERKEATHGGPGNESRNRTLRGAGAA